MQQVENMPSCQVNFVAVGPFKTGTSWIYNYLSDYQHIALPTKVKETFFFDKKFAKGIDWYYSHFEQLTPQQRIGEVAPSYFSSAKATARIYQVNPNCKILVTLREPVSRLTSFYLHMKQRGEIEPQTSFLTALSQVEILRDTAFYYRHLSHWINTFGLDNVKVIFFEELVKSPEQFSQTLCHQLDLDWEQTSRNLTEKVNSSQPPVSHNLARVIYSSVNLLHDLGLHKLVDYGKNLGIKKFLFSRKGKKFQLTQQEFTTALNLVLEDILMLESSLGLNLWEWKQTWQERGINLKQASKMHPQITHIN